MQDRYVGDIGDFVKFAVLRALSPGRRPGIAWWLHPTHSPACDGKHIGYLGSPEKWRHLNPDLFDALKQIVSSGQRHTSAIERAALLPGAAFFNETIPIEGPPGLRPSRRSGWLLRLNKSFDDRDLVFIDPDNGFEPESFNLRRARAGKSVGLTELEVLARPGRVLIIYHHQTRRAGGHSEELVYWAGRLRSHRFERVDVSRANPFSARAFFILGSDDEMRHQAAELSERWQDRITWHANESLAWSKTHVRLDWRNAEPRTPTIMNG